MASQPNDQQQLSNNPVAVIRQNLTALAPEFKAALPAHVSVEKFTRVAMTAIQNTPSLVNADRRSLFGAFVRLAQDGLLPDGREAAVVMFGQKAQAMPMIAGVLKKIRQSGEVAKVSAQVVYSNDEFVVKYGFDEDVEHVPPPLDKPRGEPIGAYATAVLKDGSQLLEVMSLEQIEKVRNVSRAAKNGPWVAWWEEMARKTVMRRLSKRLPMSTDLEEDIFSRDVTMTAAPQAIEAEATEFQEAPPMQRLDMIESSIETVEPETVEITEDFTAGEPADEAGPDAEDERESGPATSEPDPQTNDLLGQYDQQPQQPGDDPAATKANEIIGELKVAGSQAEVTAIIGRNAVHKEALGKLWQTVLQVKDARLEELKAQPAGAK